MVQTNIRGTQQPLQETSANTRTKKVYNHPMHDVEFSAFLLYFTLISYFLRLQHPSHYGHPNPHATDLSL